jgi:hypothetical protein
MNRLHVTRGHQLLAASAVLLGLLTLVATHGSVAGLGGALAYLMPGLLLLLALATRRYPGEQTPVRASLDTRHPLVRG